MDNARVMVAVTFVVVKDIFVAGYVLWILVSNTSSELNFEFSEHPDDQITSIPANASMEFWVHFLSIYLFQFSWTTMSMGKGAKRFMEPM